MMVQLAPATVIGGLQDHVDVEPLAAVRQVQVDKAQQRLIRRIDGHAERVLQILQRHDPQPQRSRGIDLQHALDLEFVTVGGGDLSAVQRGQHGLPGGVLPHIGLRKVGRHVIRIRGFGHHADRAGIGAYHLRHRAAPRQLRELDAVEQQGALERQVWRAEADDPRPR
jgi:hypothetical protein